MLQTGKTLGLTPIKCESKTGTDKLKDIHYGVNDILYKYSGRYIFQRKADEIYNKLCEYGKQLVALEVPDKAKPKKDELLSKLRVICNSLNAYRKQSQNSEDIETMQRALNWFLHRYIEVRDTMTDEQALELLKESKELSDAVYPWEDSLKLTNITKANRELLTYFTTKYQL